MKGRDRWLRHRPPADQFLDALSHLRRSFVGEGDRKNGLRHRTNVFDQMRNPVGDNARLAAPRPSQNEHRPVGSLNSLTLLRIKLGEKRQRWKRLRSFADWILQELFCDFWPDFFQSRIGHLVHPDMPIANVSSSVPVKKKREESGAQPSSAAVFSQKSVGNSLFPTMIETFWLCTRICLL